MALQRSLRSLAAGILLLLAGSLATAEEKKPNALTAKEIADGWVHLFDGETTFGWTGKAEVKDGAMVIPKGETVTFDVPLPNHDAKYDLEGCTLPGQKNDPSARRFRLEAGENGGRVKWVKVRPAATEKLFNGKDLTGWTVYKGEPKRELSKFAVTAAGELSVKNGPGDLRTEKEFDNFLLQLECKTNGPALNSGIFFRCIAGQYQNGYELQIQNAYKDGDRTKPTDFGTGAIYRRVPARKVVSNDNEWFAMTLLAHGRHFATWVNGYPVVSWKDDRPADDNPRKGLKLGKGHLSIQGHDPTTDLLFRNLRVAEVK